MTAPLFKNSLFLIDTLTITLWVLVSLIGITVWRFASRYLEGEPIGRSFLVTIPFMLLSTMVIAAANHPLVFAAGWTVLNLLLLSQLKGDGSWPAAVASSRAALLPLLGGSAILLILATAATFLDPELSVDSLREATPYSYWVAPLLVLVAAMQAGIWPFHRWLLSSLNAPTPLSAFMHAGIVNGGAVLLSRFAPPLLNHPWALDFLFALGLISAVIGCYWSLLQPDVKRMLACSTVAQLGFMLMQCGLGLFSAAIAHLFWHGLYKAYHFLNAGSHMYTKNREVREPKKRSSVVLSISFGLLSSAAFGWTSGKELLTMNSHIVLLAVAMVAGTQLALALLVNGRSWWLALLASAGFGLLYGGSVELLEGVLHGSVLEKPLPLNSLHLLGMVALLIPWLFNALYPASLPLAVRQYLFVKGLNASQPVPDAVTSIRTSYSNWGGDHGR